MAAAPRKRSDWRRLSFQELSELFHTIIRNVQPSHTLELGAHMADFSRRIVADLPDCKALAFEANPLTFKWVIENAASEIEGVQLLHAAIWSHSGLKMLRLQTSVGGEEVAPIQGNHSLLDRIAGDVKYRDLPVPALCLRDIGASLASELRSAVLWIDVEGATGPALRGAGRELMALVKAIFVEVETMPAWAGQDLAPEIDSILRDYGFVLAARDFEFRSQHNRIYLSTAALDDEVLVTTLRQASSGLAHARVVLDFANSQNP